MYEKGEFHMNAKIKKAFADYKEMVDTGKLHGFTPFEVNSIWFILNDLDEGDGSGTLSEKVANWFAEHGFSVTKKAISWTIEG